MTNLIFGFVVGGLFGMLLMCTLIANGDGGENG